MTARRARPFTRFWTCVVAIYCLGASHGHAGGSNPATEPARSRGTELIVLGTVHAPTTKYSRAALEQILAQLRPDVLLLELDESFFDATAELRAEFRDVAMESTVAVALHKSSGVALRPYDITGRNQFFAEHDYFAREARLYAALSKLDKSGELSSVAHETYHAMLALGGIRDAFMADRPDVINSAACDAAIARKHEYAFKGVARIVESTPSLAEFREFTKLADEFWVRRNDAMVANILKAAKDFPGKRIVVLCGLEHRGYLRTKLSARANGEDLALREYWEVLGK